MKKQERTYQAYLKKSKLCEIFMLGGIGIALSALIPCEIISNKIDKIEEKQGKIIEKYEESDEYFNNVESALNKNDLDYKNGVITFDQYAENLKYITSQDFSEKSLVEGDMVEYKNEYISLVEKEEKNRNAILISATSIVGVGGITAISAAGTDMILLVKNKDLIDEERKRKQKQEIPECMRIQEEKE